MELTVRAGDIYSSNLFSWKRGREAEELICLERQTGLHYPSGSGAKTQLVLNYSAILQLFFSTNPEVTLTTYLFIDNTSEDGVLVLYPLLQVHKGQLVVGDTEFVVGEKHS